MGLAFGFTLLSHIRTEICVSVFVLSVCVEYLWFNSHLDDGEYFHQSHRVAIPRKCGVAVGISLLPCIQAEIFVIVYVLPVNGGHLWFTSHPDVEDNLRQSHRVAGPHKCCYLSEVWWYHVRIRSSHLHPVWRPHFDFYGRGLKYCVTWNIRTNVLVLSYRSVETAWTNSYLFWRSRGSCWRPLSNDVYGKAWTTAGY